MKKKKKFEPIEKRSRSKGVHGLYEKTNARARVLLPVVGLKSLNSIIKYARAVRNLSYYIARICSSV